MTNGYFKDLARRTASDKVLRDKTFNIAKNCKYLASSFITSLIKKNPNQQLANEFDKPIIKKFTKKKSLFFI